MTNKAGSSPISEIDHRNSRDQQHRLSHGKSRGTETAYFGFLGFRQKSLRFFEVENQGFTD